MTLGARAFLKGFLEEFEEEKSKKSVDYFKKLFTTKKKWTEFMLGTAKSRKNGKYGLIGNVGQSFDYYVQAEWRSVDQDWFVWLPKPEGWRKAPWKNEVLVEHENNIRRLEYTFFKFGEVSAPLKVGIFYPKKDNESKALETCCQMVSKQVSSYPGTTYLIIFGFPDEKEVLVWTAYEIDEKGNKIELFED